MSFEPNWLHVSLWWVYRGRVAKYRDLFYFCRPAPKKGEK